MEELLSVLIDIKNELAEINKKLNAIQGNGVCNSIADVCKKLDDIDVTIDCLDL